MTFTLKFEIISVHIMGEVWMSNWVQIHWKNQISLPYSPHNQFCVSTAQCEIWILGPGTEPNVNSDEISRVFLFIPDVPSGRRLILAFFFVYLWTDPDGGKKKNEMNEICISK